MKSTATPDPDERRRRRVPRQARSQVLVDAILEATRLILDRDGFSALTTSRIAEVAGVSVGSLYRYFPNKQAVVTAVLETFQNEEIEASSDEDAIVARLSSVPAAEAIRAIVLYNVEYHRHLLSLGDSFYQAHHRDFSVGARVGRPAGLRRIRRVLQAHESVLKLRDLDAAAFLLARGPSSLTRQTLEESPDLLLDPDYIDDVVRLFLGFFGLAAPPEP